MNEIKCYWVREEKPTTRFVKQLVSESTYRFIKIDNAVKSLVRLKIVAKILPEDYKTLAFLSLPAFLKNGAFVVQLRTGKIKGNVFVEKFIVAIKNSHREIRIFARKNGKWIYTKTLQL